MIPTRLTDHPAKDELPAYAPDGNRLAFVSDRDDEEEIYTINASDGAKIKTLTNNGAIDTNPDWQPVTVQPRGCTFMGTPRADTIRASSGASIICGYGGNDTLYGLGGNDVLKGGGGADRLVDRSGRDRLYGGPQSDFLNIRDSNGGDLANGDSGRDRCRTDGTDTRRSCP